MTEPQWLALFHEGASEPFLYLDEKGLPRDLNRNRLGLEPWKPPRALSAMDLGSGTKHPLGSEEVYADVPVWLHVVLYRDCHTIIRPLPTAPRPTGPR